MRARKVLILSVMAVFLPFQSISAEIPPADEIPEEVARTEIILEARSPLDNRPLTAEEYALLQEEIATSPYPPRVNPKIRQLIALARLRKLLLILVPFAR
jgi:hypothetical protein